MQRELLDVFLCCPIDKAAPLQVEDGEWNGNELKTGTLRCSKCKNGYPVIAGIPNLLPPSDFQAKEVHEAKERESKARDADSTVYDDTVSTYHSEVELSALLDGLK